MTAQAGRPGINSPGPGRSPNIRTVDQLTGQRGPDAFFKGLEEADSRIAERSELYRQIEELRAENASLRCRLAELESRERRAAGAWR